MPEYKTNENWFTHLSASDQHKFFEYFKGDFQAFLIWCSEPYSEKSKYIKQWQKQN